MKQGFVIHFNGPAANCVGQGHARCERFWAAVKRYHGEKFGSKWAATSLYSFGVCPHGTRFTGCGWDRNQAANGSDVVGEFDGRDSEWFTVLVFLGEGEKPTNAMVVGTQALIQQGRDLGKCGLRVLPHNAFKRKTCPGPEFTQYAKDWDNRRFGTTTPEPTPAIEEDDDMHAGEVIASYIEAYGTPTKDQGRDMRAWIHDIYSKPTKAERDGGVLYLRAALGLPG